MQPIQLARIRHTESSRFLTEDRQPSPPQDAFPYSLALDQDALDAIRPPWRRDLHALLEQPTSSSPAFFIHAFITFLIITSAIVTVLETVPAFHSISGRIWFGLETSFVALFTMEYIARCFAWSNTWLSLAKWIFCERLIIILFANLNLNLGESILWHHRLACDLSLLLRNNAESRHGMLQNTIAAIECE
jgi:potassium voltage-gated channel Shal-related subfamily D member 2